MKKTFLLFVSVLCIIHYSSAQEIETEINDIGNDGHVTLKMTTLNPNPGDLRLGFEPTTKQAILGTVTDTDMSLYTDNEERMRITSTGRVGIGTSSPSQALHIAGEGAGNTILRLTHDDLNTVGARQIGIEMYAPGNGPSIDGRDWRMVNKISGLAFETALNQNSIFDEIFRMGVSGSNTFSFFQSTLGIGRFPSRVLDVQEDTDDLIARFAQTSQGAVGLELVRQTGNVNTTNRDWQIVNDDNGIFRIGDSSNGTNYTTEFRLSPTVASVDADFRPLQDNVFDLGSATDRWDNVYATNPIIVTSDVRQKREIHVIEYGLEAVNKLRPVSYYWKSGDSEKKLGLIAQEVLNVIPEAVNVPKEDDGLYGMSYTELVPVLVQAINELTIVIKDQEERISELETN